mmetsp:Transcript_11223/g.33363  ORF Transcript_11223/g.33363 Transcript_11223/m.33363 type:complete len:260 (-) Transcript_11223:1015-1794(-)
MGLEDLARDTQAEARAPRALKLAAAHLDEEVVPAEHIELLPVQADARILDGDHQVLAPVLLPRALCHGDRHRAALGSELERVGYAIVEALLQARQVPAHAHAREGRRRGHQAEVNSFGLSCGLESGAGNGEQIPPAEGDGYHVHAAAVDALKVEHVAHDLLHERAELAQLVDGLPHASVIPARVAREGLERFGEVVHSEKWRSQVCSGRCAGREARGASTLRSQTIRHGPCMITAPSTLGLGGAQGRRAAAHYRAWRCE